MYQKEYEQFVASMSYAAEDDQIEFEEAVKAFERIVCHLKNSGC